MSMKNKLIFFIVFILVAVLTISCGGSDDSEPALSSQKVITGFTISGVSAIINESENIISVILPDDTPLQSLAPQIQISNNATVSPASGASVDFTNSVIYTVTAEDGSSQTYTVFVADLIYEFMVNNKQYELVRQESTWEEAVAFAVDRGGYLAEINDGGENNGIFSEINDNAQIVFENNTGRAAVWMGGNDIATEGTWILDGNNDGVGAQFWDGGIDGSAVGGLYNNWGNEPDNAGDQDALSLVIRATAINEAGQWNDLDGSEPLFFVIEYD